jgi:hypothetical protein
VKKVRKGVRIAYLVRVGAGTTGRVRVRVR